MVVRRREGEWKEGREEDEHGFSGGLRVRLISNKGHEAAFKGAMRRLAPQGLSYMIWHHGSCTAQKGRPISLTISGRRSDLVDILLGTSLQRPQER